MLKKCLSYFSGLEIGLWSGSVLVSVIAFLLFDGENSMMLTASVIGATYLIFNAKGNPFGQLLLIVFSVLYGIISYSFAYYGEMLTYLGMATPMAVIALISWLRHPSSESKAEVQINTLHRKEFVFMIVLSAAVTGIFYSILKYFHTANLILSTVSVFTSFLAVCLTIRRSCYFAIAYAANDIVLLLLWTLAAFTDRSYISVIICFVMFLINDIYTYINWKKLFQKQRRTASTDI